MGPVRLAVLVTVRREPVEWFMFTLWSVTESALLIVGIAGDAITADLYYGRKTAGQHAEPVDESTPVFDGISISGISCTGAARAIWLNGLPEMPIRNISISNSTISAEAGAIINNADSKTPFSNLAEWRF